MGSDFDTERTTSQAGMPVLDATRMFPRLQLPPVPRFRVPEDQEFDAPATTADGVIVPLRDEPVWASPYAPVADPELQYRLMVESVATMSGAHRAPAPAAELAPSPVPEPVAYMPQLDTEPPAIEAEPSVLAIAIVLVTAAGLVWASRMAFSPALLALAGLLVAQLAAASAAAPRAGRRPLLLAVPSAALALLAAKGGLHGFSDTAFVAGLFVLAAAVPTLLLFGALQFVLRRRADASSPADLVLRSGWKLRAGALLATLLAGAQAHRTFSAVPDAIVTFGIVALIALTLVGALRKADRVSGQATG